MTCAWCDKEPAFLVGHMPVCEHHLIDELAEALVEKLSVTVEIPVQS